MRGRAGEGVRGENIHFSFRFSEVFFIESRDFFRSLFFGARFFFDFVFAGIALRDVICRQVSDIGNVFDVTHFISQAFQNAPQKIGSEVGAEVSDMHISVDGWTAGIDTDFSGMNRLERLFLFGEGIVEEKHTR